jgi:hypothetical protein
VCHLDASRDQIDTAVTAAQKLLRA